MKSYKFRIYPNKQQEGIFNQTLFSCFKLYNTAIEQRKEAYRISKKYVSAFEQEKELPLIKEQFPEYSVIYSQVLKSVLKRVDFAFKSFFRRVKISNNKAGFPRYKPLNRYDSFCYPQFGFSIVNNKIKLSKIGLIKCKFHRQIPNGAKIINCTIKHECEKWFVMFVCENTAPIPKKKVVGCAVGIDLGLTNFVVLSNGAEIKNPKYLKQSEEKLKELQSEYSKGKSETVRKKLANLYRKVSNQRKDFQNKISFSLVHTFDLIAYEDLKIKNMIEDNKYNLQKHISDAGWGQFISMIKYKAESAGTYAIAVNPKGTTQKCSGCGTIVPKDLTVRLHKCTFCGFEASRDVNAALNIHKLGISLCDGLLPHEVPIRDNSRAPKRINK